MKKFITTAITSIVYYGMLAALLFAAITDTRPLLNVVAAAFWVVILLGGVMGCLYLAIAYGLDSISLSKNENAQQENIKLLERLTRRKNLIFRVWGWVCLAAGAALLAYGGWVFTSVCYVLASLFVRLCTSVARDKLTSFSAAQPAV